MANYIFGDIDNVSEGAVFADRQALRAIGLHLALMAGIDGNAKIGASSIVLSGGYVDDIDNGDEIVYTGHGGNDPKTKQQIHDQSWDSIGNKALLISEIQSLPVRVIRGFKHDSVYSPTKGYKYGGLYRVVAHFKEKGKNGFMICRFYLKKITSNETNKFEYQNQLIEESQPPSISRNTITLSRIVRDTTLVQKIKKLYDYTCQICMLQIGNKDIKYAEAAHIKPLGTPHNGNDSIDNMLCLCPNHHVMLDKGLLSINNDFCLIGLEGNLNLHPNHTIDTDNIIYHQNYIYIN